MCPGGVSWRGSGGVLEGFWRGILEVCLGRESWRCVLVGNPGGASWSCIMEVCPEGVFWICTSMSGWITVQEVCLSLRQCMVFQGNLK